MQVQQLPIYQFLEGSGKSFIIPVYQRDYAWTRINCQKLWDDLVDLNNNTRVDHFLGTLVTIGSGFQEYTVIDGQQRLTTTSILLIALHNYLKDKKNKDSYEDFLLTELLNFLVNRGPEETKRIRLKPNKQDKEYFENLFANGNAENVNSNIVSNYNFFYEKIKSEILSPQEVFDAFRKLKIVLIDLVRGQDDPQLIFESLNSTGVDLTAGDLIRNYILMDLQPVEQEKMYKTYWITIEKLTENIAEFVRNYLIFKTKIWVKKDDVYTVFKKFSLETFNQDKEAVLKDLLYFAEIYGWLVQINKHSSSAVNKQLERLNKLEFTVSHPYLLDVFNDLRNNVISEEIVKEILILIESYAFRKILVDNTTQGLNKMFITLSKEIKKEESWKEDYLNILSYIILEKRISQRFPTDEEFENSLLVKEIYQLQHKNKRFILESLENYFNNTVLNLEEFTIEHIMPQTLTREWKNVLGENWQEIHGKYLHTIGNLTLTMNNSENSNKSFVEKLKDFETAKLDLNQELLENIKIWNEDKILKRAKNLIEKSKKIWIFPKTSYEKPIPEEQIFDLTSEDSFSGSKPSRLFIEDDEKGIELKTWTDILLKVLNFLYEFSPTEFIKIEKSNEYKYLFDINNDKYMHSKFAEGHFIIGHYSSNNIIKMLKKICEKLNYPAENISFSIKDTKE